MKGSEDPLSNVVVAGFGSSHGDDQAGWRVAAMLKRRIDLPVRVVVVHDATQLLDLLPGCERLIVVDACRTGGDVGSVTRLCWPDQRIAQQCNHSTHGVSVAEALQLAAQFERLPPVVEIYGIEIARAAPGSGVSPTVLHAVIQVESEICERLQEMAPA